MRGRQRPLLLTLPALVPTAAVVGTGVVAAGLQSIGLAPSVGAPAASVDAYRAAASGTALRESLSLSLGLATVSTAIALVVGFGVAVLVRRSRAGGRVLAAAASLTVPVPHLVGATAIGLLLADSGLVARLPFVDGGAFPPLVAGPWWVAVVAEYAWKESAFVALVVLGALSAAEGGLSEAAATLGAAPLARLRRVTLPLASPALVASGGISFAYVVGSYEVPWLLGRTSPEPLPVLAYRLSTDIDLTTRPEAAAVAVVTIALSAGVLVATALLLRRLPWTA